MSRIKVARTGQLAINFQGQPGGLTPAPKATDLQNKAVEDKKIGGLKQNLLCLQEINNSGNNCRRKPLKDFGGC